MFEIVTGILQFTFGLISNKIRSYSSVKLQESDPTDEHFRTVIVRELDEIKFKLDANARKDLSSSISCLKQGTERLVMSFSDASDSVMNEGTSEKRNGSNTPQNNFKTAVAACSPETNHVGTSVAVNEALVLANTIHLLKLSSNVRLELAKESFKEAGNEARRAFHNAALSTEERILACKIRIGSAVLEHLDDPEVAASDCLQYLQELHTMPAVQGTFLVHKTGGLKSLFNKAKRAEIVDAVTMINLMLADFVSQFTKLVMGVLDWPVVDCHNLIVHPIYSDESSLQQMEENNITPPWHTIQLDSSLSCSDPFSCAITSNGDIITCGKDGLKKVNKTTGKLEPFCQTSPDSQSLYEGMVYNHVIADEGDIVYAIYGDRSVETTTYFISVFNENGSVERCRPLTMRGKSWMYMAVRNQMLVFLCADHSVHVCDQNGKLKCMFQVSQTMKQRLADVFISCDNEILVVAKRDFFYYIYSFTVDGQFKETVKFAAGGNGVSYNNSCICYHHATNSYIIYVLDCSNKALLHCISRAGELRGTNLLDADTNIREESKFRHLVSHQKGALALVGPDSLLYLYCFPSNKLNGKFSRQDMPLPSS